MKTKNLFITGCCLLSQVNIFAQTCQQDDFTGTAINTSCWTVSESGTATVTQNDSLIITATDGGAGTLTSTFFLSGDFDVQVDWKLINWPQPPADSTGANLTINAAIGMRIDTCNYQHISRMRWGSPITTERSETGGITNCGIYQKSYFMETFTDSKFRITRSGSNVTFYQWEGTSWIQKRYINSTSLQGNASIYLQASGKLYEGNDFQVAFDNFIINSGTACNVNLGEDKTICQNDSLVLNVNSSYSNIIWQDSSTNASYAVSVPGTYWVAISDSNCTTSDTIIVKENLLPIVNLGNDTALCQGTSIALDAGKDFENYVWSTGANTQTINVNSSNTYFVKITDTNGCANSDTIIVTAKICTAINDQQQAFSIRFQIFPNPSDGQFTIAITNNEQGITNNEVKIINVLGQTVYQQTLNAKQQTLNTKFSKGVYFLQVITEEGVWTNKIIVND